MKTMAWRLLSLLLFYSLAVVWAAPVPTPDYEDTLPLRESACWVSIKMEDMSLEGRSPLILLNRLLRTFGKHRVSLKLYGVPEPQDSKQLFSSDISETLLKKAKIEAFKWMPCYANPSNAAALELCQNKALKACPSKSFENVLLIYGIQQWRKDVLHESLEELSKKAKKPQRFKIALFIDCQNPTDMDMNNNPTNCQGGRRLDFDPTFSNHFPRSQIEIRSGGWICSDTEIYPGGLLAREKVEGSFVMTLDSEGGMSYDPIFPSSGITDDVALLATNEGIVLLDSDYNVKEMNREGVFKNVFSELTQSLMIRRKNKEGIEEKLEHTLQPKEKVKVKLLPHIEVYPFFSLPELVVGKNTEEKKKSEEPLYFFHFKLLADEAREGDNSVAQVKKERLRHKNLHLKTVTCRRTKNESALINCFVKTKHIIDQVSRVFVSSGDREVLNEAIATILIPPFKKKPWKPYYELMSAKYRFIEVGGRLIDSKPSNPDPKNVPPRPLGERLKRWFLRLLRRRQTNFAKLDAQPFTKGELHLDVALFHAYRPLHAPYSVVHIGVFRKQILACFGRMEIEFHGDSYVLDMKRRSEKGFYLKNEEKHTFPPKNIAIRNDFQSLVIFEVGKTKETILQNVSEMTFNPIGELERKPDKLDFTIWCSNWHPELKKGDFLRKKGLKAKITFLDIGLRSTAIFQ